MGRCSVRFTKMQGLGNDFIVYRDGEVPSAIRAAELCRRGSGIGADGLIIPLPSEKADVAMLLINSDGSVAPMCGNGIRCFARFVYEQGIVKTPEMTIETPSGIRRAELIFRGGSAAGARVDMGAPLLNKPDIPMQGSGKCQLERITAGDREFTFSAANTGAPHIAVFDSASEADIIKYGPLLERHPLFPKGVNVNFVEALPGGRLFVRTWERGCGRTLACGTGSCAAVVLSSLAGLCGRSATVKLALGELMIDWAEDGRVYMTGPAERVFEGEV